MDKELISFFKDAFCGHLKKIKSDIEQNSGAFKNRGMLDDTLDCIRGIKDLNKISAAADSKPAVSGATMLGK